MVAWTEEVAEAAPRVHVKLDTGMSRLGTKDLRAGAAAGGAAERRGPHDPLRHRRRARRRAVPRPARALPRVRDGVGRDELQVHAANSAAALREPDCWFDMVRCGVAVYGLDPFQRDPAEHGLEPALTLRSWVAAMRRLEPGESAGYGRRWTARGAHLARHGADRLRRRLAAGAHEQRGRADRRPPPPAGGGGEHGQRDRGARPGHRRGGGGRGRPDRRAGRASGSSPRRWRGGSGTINYEVTTRPAAARDARAQGA